MGLDTQRNSFMLYARFQQREGQRIETERTFVNFAQLAHRGEDRRRTGKKWPVVNLADSTGKTER